MKYLRLVQSGYENYTGPIGPYEFIDGVSAHTIPRNDRDRLATAFEFVEYENEGDPHVPAGVAHRLVMLSGVRAEVHVPLERQTDDEKVAENKTAAAAEPARTIYKRKDLETIADKRGISGLREIGDTWGVKNRQIVTLIEMILHAQEVWLEMREKATEERRDAEGKFEADAAAAVLAEQNIEAPAPEESKPEGKDDEDDFDQEVPEEIKTPEDIAAAAASGDMSAALNAE